MKTIARLLMISLTLTASSGRAVELGAGHDAGQVLLFPFYSASSGAAEAFSTVVTLSGRGSTVGATAAEPVAIRVAFRVPPIDGQQPPPRLINLLLRGHDSWTFAATNGVLVSHDESCAIGEAGALVPSTSGVPLPGPEGWIEVFELGRITSADVIARLERADRVQACQELATLLPTLATTAWLSAPDNRLRGTSHLVSVSTGTSFTVTPTVLRDFRDAPVHAPATQDVPSLADVHPARADVTLADGGRRSSMFGSRPIDAVSAVLMSAEWEMDYEISTALAARTDVVLTLPTRRWYVDAGQVDPPFEHPTRALGAFELNAKVFDREGDLPAGAVAKCTPPISVPELGPVIDSSQITLKLGEDSALYATSARPLTYAVQDPFSCAIGGLVPQTLPEGGFRSGRVTLQFVDGPRAPTADSGFGTLFSDEDHVFRGMPVIGTAATSVINVNALPGRIANYGVDQPIVRRARYELPETR
jgi:hypothetical protein